MGWARELSRVLWRSLSKRVKQPVGTDKFGNKYYYIPEYKNWRGQTIREKRIVEAATKREVDYEVGDIPTEWEAWIRRTRKTPPTVELSAHLSHLLQDHAWSLTLPCPPALGLAAADDTKSRFRRSFHVSFYFSNIYLLNKGRKK
ncbi:NADH dehydrogenase [ubiquinone] 1 alpha subcomplex assembly factor 2 isoform X3 [Erinaceus europaeus]|uniref:NADH dehydrogenase [ubiquinone] 1 alpha subcomplex assembly factor 2 isoform X3 n=1 Tax=Erinaceus europaeus TaxID=9365 RepID=A0ABM3XEP1_ERIEU|nr:NADH dehydrogenase [ubiquinone] 1 alpha subcomplex assembly factor 2 isoform X3 [Erinaceus europaeus]